eukprot:SAG25_NODE_14691_length_252_cov_0.666667_1_plen_57_part_10
MMYRLVRQIDRRPDSVHPPHFSICSFAQLVPIWEAGRQIEAIRGTEFPTGTTAKYVA